MDPGYFFPHLPLLTFKHNGHSRQAHIACYNVYLKPTKKTSGYWLALADGIVSADEPEVVGQRE